MITLLAEMSWPDAVAVSVGSIASAACAIGFFWMLYKMTND